MRRPHLAQTLRDLFAIPIQTLASGEVPHEWSSLTGFGKVPPCLAMLSSYAVFMRFRPASVLALVILFAQGTAALHLAHLKVAHGPDQQAAVACSGHTCHTHPGDPSEVPASPDQDNDTCNECQMLVLAAAVLAAPVQSVMTATSTWHHFVQPSDPVLTARRSRQPARAPPTA